MLKNNLLSIKNLDFSFEHSIVKIVANRNHPEIKLAGITIGPFVEGNEYEVYYWIAEELEKTSIAHFREQQLDVSKLYKIQWTERVQTAGQVSKLPEHFYPQLRRCLKKLKKETNKNSEKLREYEKIKQLTLDIVNSRLKKIVSIASTITPTEQVLKNLVEEERLLYNKLYRFINEWRSQITFHEGSDS